MPVAPITSPEPALGRPLAQFFVPASASLQERRPRTLKHGDTFAVFDPNGDALAGPGSPEGLYHRDTRYLSHLYLTIDGLRPLLLSSTLQDDNVVLTCDLTNPDVLDARGRITLQHDVIHIRRTRFLWQARVLERIALHNYSPLTAQRVRLGLDFGSDFADIFEVRGSIRARRGIAHPASVTDDEVRLSYTGLDGELRETRLRFESAPTALTADGASFDVTLNPNERKTLFLEIRCGGGLGRPPRRAFFSGFREARLSLRRSASRAAAISSSHEVFNEAVRRAVSDLYMLVTETPEGPFPYAGIPWFSTVFGRDALITGLQTLWLDPAIARGVLRHLAAHQAVDENPAADAEPGKILHEVRYGEMAALGEVPFRCYYGSVDATPLFVMLAGAYLERTGDRATVRELWPNIRAALDWLATRGDRHGDGFVDYGRRTAQGLANQGWKDSYDAVFHADGELANGPVALVEVQAYVYGALRAAAAIAERLDPGDGEAGTLRRRAEALRRRFDEAFFDEELGTYVLALDGKRRPCRVRSSNAGHALFTGIALPERAESVVRDLMQPSFFSGWGLRTLATTEARYNPMSYHNGSVWPHDNAIIAAGMARYSYRQEAAAIFRGLFEASTYIDQRRLPELFCGFPRLRSHGPTFYPVACSPQAWAATATFSLLQSCLGLGFDPTANCVTFDEPVIPDFLEDVTLRNVVLPAGRLDVTLTRHHTEVAARVLARQGRVRALTRT
jgi:glycogen debranching enzyme